MRTDRGEGLGMEWIVFDYAGVISLAPPEHAGRLLPHTVVVPGTHLLMVPAMLGAMLYRWRDYTCH